MEQSNKIVYQLQSNAYIIYIWQQYGIYERSFGLSVSRLLEVSEVFIEVLEYFKALHTLMFDQLLPTFLDFRFLNPLLSFLFLLFLCFEGFESLAGLFQLLLPLLLLLLSPDLVFLHLALSLFFLSCFFLLDKLSHKLSSGVLLLDQCNQLLDACNIQFPLLLSFFIVLLLHLPSYLSVLSILQVVFISPSECLKCLESFPLGVEFNVILGSSPAISEPHVLSVYLLRLVFSLIKVVGLVKLECLPLFFLYELEYLSVDCVEAFWSIFKILEATILKVRLDVETHTLELELLLGHLVFVEEDRLTVVVVPCPLVHVGQNFPGLLDLHEAFFCILLFALIGVVFQGKLLILRLQLCRSGVSGSFKYLVVTSFFSLDRQRSMSLCVGRLGFFVLLHFKTIFLVLVFSDNC